MNMNKIRFESKVSDIFSVLGNPFRIKVLYAIGKGEACVCHLEAMLKKRQAYISQHLMVMRDAGLLKTRREGKYIFYRIADLTVLEMVGQVAEMLGLPPREIPEIATPATQASCPCPNCEKELQAQVVSK